MARILVSILVKSDDSSVLRCINISNMCYWSTYFDSNKQFQLRRLSSQSPLSLRFLYLAPNSDGPHATPTLDLTPWMYLSNQINSSGTNVEEISLISGCRFYSIEDKMG